MTLNDAKPEEWNKVSRNMHTQAFCSICGIDIKEGDMCGLCGLCEKWFKENRGEGEMGTNYYITLIHHYDNHAAFNFDIKISLHLGKSSCLKEDEGYLFTIDNSSGLFPDADELLREVIKMEKQVCNEYGDGVDFTKILLLASKVEVRTIPFS